MVIDILGSKKHDNSYEIVENITSKDGILVIGETKYDYSIKVRKDRQNGLTGAHEVGHTLMKTRNQDEEHSKEGIMTSIANDNNRGEYVSQETVDVIVESHDYDFENNKQIWKSVISIFK